MQLSELLKQYDFLSSFMNSDKSINGECQDVGDTAAQWFSKYLGIECRLYYMAPSHKPRYTSEHSRYGSLAKPNEQVICCHVCNIFAHICSIQLIIKLLIFQHYLFIQCDLLCNQICTV